MTIPNVDVVRAANEKAKHVMIHVLYDGDEFYAALRRCDELLAEVERLRRIYEAVNPCPKCGTLNLVKRIDTTSAAISLDDVLTDDRYSAEAREQLSAWRRLQTTEKPGQCPSQKYMHWGSTIQCVLAIRHAGSDHTSGSWEWKDGEEGVVP